MSWSIESYNIPVVKRDKKPPSGLDAMVHYLVGKIKRRSGYVTDLYRRAEDIVHLSSELANLEDDELNMRMEESRRSVRFGADEHDIDSALALISEVASRELSMRPYPEQLMGSLALFQQAAIEMKPGEGKTLTACLANIVFAWRGTLCHVVTSNDYLAARDAVLMKKLYERCSVSVGYIIDEMDEKERRLGYQQDVVYATSKELLADYLRDSLVLGGERDADLLLLEKLKGSDFHEKVVMRGLHTVIIDEADSVLIDDATTPLIISMPRQNRFLKEATLAVASIASLFVVNEHYIVNYRHHDIEFLPQGYGLIESKLLDLPVVWQVESRCEALLRQALLARELYHLNKHYVIVEGKIVIVDEKTGRLMHGRSWSYGLHQAIEAKEGLALTDPTSTNAKMSFQRFFRLYRSISGMSGTFQKVENELWRIYKLPVIRIPTHRSGRRKVLPEIVLGSKDLKFRRIVDEVLKYRSIQRPVLVGTRSIAENEMLARELMSLGIECSVLNATHHSREAEIIALAGQLGSVTVATNMAGRGTDILLGDGVDELGGLHVIATERHESRRVDLQLFGRSARQGNRGSAQAFISIDDPIMERMCPQWFSRVLKRILHLTVGRKIALWVYITVQSLSESVAYHHRIQMLNDDYKLDDILSFSDR